MCIYVYMYICVYVEEELLHVEDRDPVDKEPLYINKMFRYVDMCIQSDKDP